MKLFRIIPDSDIYYKLRTVIDSPNGNESLINYSSYQNKWIAPTIEIIKDGKPADFLSWAGNIVCSDKSFY